MQYPFEYLVFLVRVNGADQFVDYAKELFVLIIYYRYSYTKGIMSVHEFHNYYSPRVCFFPAPSHVTIYYKDANRRTLIFIPRQCNRDLYLVQSYSFRRLCHLQDCSRKNCPFQYVRSIHPLPNLFHECCSCSYLHHIKFNKDNILVEPCIYIIKNQVSNKNTIFRLDILSLFESP